MSQFNCLTEFLNGVNVPALASLPADGQIHIPCTHKDTHILPLHHPPNVLVSECVLCWTTPHSNIYLPRNNTLFSSTLKLFQVMLLEHPQQLWGWSLVFHPIL